MIVRNEERNLSACLKPFLGLVDEVIVVDTGSTDETRELAGKLGAKVSYFPWEDDFSAARNESLRQASGQWILWLDADDRIDEANREKLRDLLGRLPAEPRGFVMKTVSPPSHSTAPSMVISHPRLFPAHSGIRWEGRVHEQIAPSLERLGVPLEMVDITIQHVGYQEASLQQRKANRDLRLLRIDFATDPENPSTLFHLGCAHLRLGQHEPALTYLLMALKHAGASPGDWVRRLYTVASETLTKLARHEEALALASEGLRRFPLDPELVLRRADLLWDLDQLGAAQRQLEEFLASSTSAVHLYHGAEDTFNRRGARSMLACILRSQRQFESAQRIFQELLADRPDDIGTWVNLGYCYLYPGRLKEVEYVARQLEKCDKGDIYADVMRAEACLQRLEFAEAHEHLQRAISNGPQLVWARMVLSDLLVKEGADRESCLAAQRDILRLDPGNVAALRRMQALQQTPTSPGSDPLGWSITIGAQ
jgi:tetratricopeptide (TPR) repeat protein